MYNPFSNQLTEAGLVLENGRSVQLNVEEEIKRGIGPAATLLQHMVELTVLALLNNLKHVTLNPVRVGLNFSPVRVHSSIEIASTTHEFSFLAPCTISTVHNYIDRDNDIGTK